jgi:hypothetical protein
MIHLGSAASLEVVTASGVADCVMTYAYTDLNTSTGAVTPGTPTNKSVSTATTTTLVAGVASTIRRVHSVLIRNTHASSSNAVTVQHDDGTTVVPYRTVTLLAGWALQYSDANGWQVFDSTGRAATNTSANGSAAAVNSLNTVVLASDVTNNNASANSIADVTGLSFSVTSGETYWFRFMCDYTAAATTTGSRWAVNGPSATRLSYRSSYSLTTTSDTVNSGLTAYDLPAASNATSAATGGNVAMVEGYITPSANGTVILRFASEVSSSAIVAKAGSLLQWVRTL